MTTSKHISLVVSCFHTFIISIIIIIKNESKQNETAELNLVALSISLNFLFQGEPGHMGLPGATGPPGTGTAGAKVQQDHVVQTNSLSKCQQQHLIHACVFSLVREKWAPRVQLELQETRGRV